ncbi:caspase family protein [Nocardia fluminea]|uniref:caspase family protein n=1 Tax=Nocardia fluminea TaxID=134984 RepID=UPI003D098D20
MADYVARRRSRALLVGVASYNDPTLPDLPSADRAAKDLARGFAPADGSILVDTVVNADRHEFAQALIQACDEAEDQLILYFAGHGVQSKYGELILGTRDLNSQWPDMSGMSWNDVRRALAGTRARSVVVILDCCFSGATHSALQESQRVVDDAINRPLGTYLLAGRAPWPYQPGVLGAALRTAMKATSVEDGSSPDLALLAARAHDEMVRVGQHTLAITASSGRPPHTSHVFISNRPADRAFASVLDDAIADRLGRAAVLRPSRESLPPGVIWRTAITRDILRSKVVVVVIGPDWEVLSTAPGAWAVDEIATAFEHGILVVPVIVGARGPVHAEDMPDRIRQLAYLQFLQVRSDSEPAAVDAVVGRLLELL